MNQFSSITAAAVGLCATVDRKSFADAAKAMKKIVEKRNTIPILSHVLVTLSADKVTLQGTDLDLQLSVEIPAGCACAGSFTIEAFGLIDALAKLKGDSLFVRHLGSKVELSCNQTGARITLASLPATDFPHLKLQDAGASFTMPESALVAALDSVSHAISTEETRYYLNGAFMHVTGDTLKFIATDGHRLACYDAGLPEGAETLADAIVPTKAVKALLGIIGKKAAGYVSILQRGTSIQFSFGRFRLLTKIIDGTFPDYTRVIPNANDKRLSVDSPALVAALATVTATQTERTRAVALSAVDGQPLVLSTTSIENGRAATAIDAHHVGGEIAIGFNAAYLVAAAKQFKGSMTLVLADAAAPTRIESVDRPELTLVLMPMRVDASVMTVADVDALNKSPMDKLMEAGGGAMGAKAFGLIQRDAVAYLVASGTETARARQIVKTLAAINGGDDTGHAKGALYTQALNGGTARSFAAMNGAPVETPAAPVGDEDLREASEGFDCSACGRPEFDCSREPCADVIADRDEEASDEADAVELVGPVETPAEPVEPEPESVAALSAETETPAEPMQDNQIATDSPVAPIKVETVYGQIVFVDADDFASDKPLVRRRHKDGREFVERESQGGAWQRICRDNIKRQVLGRNSPNKPRAVPVATPAAPMVDVALGERLAALESIVAGLGQPVAVTLEPVAKRSAAHVRAIRAYLQLRQSRAVLAKVQAARDTNLLNACSSMRAADSNAAKLKAAIECRDIAVAETNQLRVRCKALESLHAVSEQVDAMPSSAKIGLIMPVATAGPRAR